MSATTTSTSVCVNHWALVRLGEKQERKAHHEARLLYTDPRAGDGAWFLATYIEMRKRGGL